MSQRWYATGRRKSASSRVWITLGTGEITINGRQPAEYFRRASLEMVMQQPLELTETLGRIDVKATVRGGGIAGQAGAIRHGISRALTGFDPETRPALKRAGMLTRDSRIKERKKYGQPGARKRFQFSKR